VLRNVCSVLCFPGVNCSAKEIFGGFKISTVSGFKRLVCAFTRSLRADLKQLFCESELATDKHPRSGGDDWHSVRVVKSSEALIHTTIDEVDLDGQHPQSPVRFERGVPEIDVCASGQLLLWSRPCVTKGHD